MNYLNFIILIYINTIWIRKTDITSIIIVYEQQLFSKKRVNGFRLILTTVLFSRFPLEFARTTTKNCPDLYRNTARTNRAETPSIRFMYSTICLTTKSLKNTEDLN